MLSYVYQLSRHQNTSLVAPTLGQNDRMWECPNIIIIIIFTPGPRPYGDR